MCAVDPLAAGRLRLATPVLPLIRLIHLLYLTGPFDTIAAVLDELPEPLEAGNVVYPQAGAMLRPYLRELRELEHGGRLAGTAVIRDEHGELLDDFEASELQVAQQVLSMELEEINSLLCEPCDCNLCCVGPDDGMRQEFFEIPLSGEETWRFSLPVVDTDESRARKSSSEPPLTHEGRIFYKAEPALYHWQNGWSLILPRHSRCPQLDSAGCRCLIYRERPEVCRRPQIFPYLLELAPDPDRSGSNASGSAYTARRKLLAVWDCPYVRKLDDEIARYAELSGLEPVFRSNKE